MLGKCGSSFGARVLDFTGFYSPWIRAWTCQSGSARSRQKVPMEGRLSPVLRFALLCHSHLACLWLTWKTRVNYCLQMGGSKDCLWHVLQLHARVIEQEGISLNELIFASLEWSRRTWIILMSNFWTDLQPFRSSMTASVGSHSTALSAIAVLKTVVRNVPR